MTSIKFSDYIRKQADELRKAGDGYEALSDTSKSCIDYAVQRYVDEYAAKQQSIAFMHHCLEAGYLKPDENGSVQLDYNYWHESNFTKASEEIYTKFIEQQNKE